MIYQVGNSTIFFVTNFAAGISTQNFHITKLLNCWSGKWQKYFRKIG